MTSQNINLLRSIYCRVPPQAAKSLLPMGKKTVTNKYRLVVLYRLLMDWVKTSNDSLRLAVNIKILDNLFC
ncbi:hypothetical protein V6N13_134670 [Hibiscus sabdariffa]